MKTDVEIELFLARKLSAKSLSEFEANLLVDQELRERVDLIILAQAGSRILREEQLRVKLEEWKTEVHLVNSSKTYSIKIFIAVVGVIIFATFIFDKIYNDKSEKQSDPVEELIYASNEVEADDYAYQVLSNSQYKVPSNLDLTLRGASSGGSSKQLDQAINYFKQGKFDEAIILLEREKNTSDVLTSSDEWLAHSYYENGDYDKAAKQFLSIYRVSELTVKDRSEWYYLLSLLPNFDENQNRIEDLVAKISNVENNHLYFKQAIKLDSLIAKESRK